MPYIAQPLVKMITCTSNCLTKTITRNGRKFTKRQYDLFQLHWKGESVKIPVSGQFDLDENSNLHINSLFAATSF